MSDVLSQAQSAGRTPPKTVNRLTVKQIFDLCKWPEDLQPTFTVDTTPEYLAVKASEYFKHHITAYNIRGAFETADLKLPQPPKSDKQQVVVLKKYLCEMYKLLQGEVPQELLDL